MPPNSPSPLERNLLLRSLPPVERSRLLPHAEVVTLVRGDVLFEPGDEVTAMIFPLDGTVVSLIVPLEEGRTIETATVGREGALGGVVSQGYLPAFNRAVVQMGGAAVRLDAARMQAAKRTSLPIRNALVRYADCLLAQVVQSVACNAAHPIEQRCARWVLALHDRLATDVLPVTQDMLAEMLGVRRTYLSGILNRLQAQGLIEMGRARITVRDRPALQAASCECHRRVQEHFALVLGATFTPAGTLVALDPEGAPDPLATHGVISA
ncbi:Crp/Fnr family transcriptional regulator [Methylobacterium fujisawaense]|uniref:Crp/Fnr family transcriptional regulator n=1 Tax=Methylobacterium fujisawaense TaxID=107400 RepID=UPI0006AEE1AA|nr:Crp/Fnr family transcriptional regulator [Streptomyces purpurogeneiscleroticus]